MRRFKRLSSLLVIVLLQFSAHAYGQKRLTSTYTLQWGVADMQCSYLSPVSHSGSRWGLRGDWETELLSSLPEWRMRFTAEAAYSRGLNRARTANLEDIALDLGWRATHCWKPVAELFLEAGAGIQVDAGAMYMPRNSNNPVAARAYMGFSLEGKASYILKIRNYPIILSDNLSIPSLGVFFTPAYGQSYYEIYLGQRSGLASCAWWGNRTALSNHLKAGFPVGKVILEAGYRIDFLNSNARGIHTRILSHNLTVSITTSWINVTSAAY